MEGFQWDVKIILCGGKLSRFSRRNGTVRSILEELFQRHNVQNNVKKLEAGGRV